MEDADLPKEWLKPTIGDVALNANNLRKPISLKKRAEIKGPYPYYGATGQIDSLNDYTHEGEYILIGEDGANLLSKSKPLAFLVDGKYWVNNHAHSLRSLADMPNNFLCSYVNSLNLVPWVTGSAQPKLTRGNLDSIPAPLPPLAEQKVIADRLDTLLTQVETTKVRLDRIPGILKRFRQSVLAAAVSGRLTENWRENQELQDWQMTKLGSIVESIEAGKNLKCIETPPNDDEHGIIKISAVTWGIYDENQSKTLPDNDQFIESRRINVGDFLISRANTIELLGNPVIVHEVTRNLMLSDKVLRLIMKDENKPWVSIFLRSGAGRKEIESRSTGNQMSMRNIGQKALLDIDLPKPPDEEQTEIVRRVQQLFTHADKIEQKLQSATTRVKNLTQSILAKAFRGELTADWRAANPDLISGENSAEALLEKIKAEREAMKPKKKTRARKVKA